MKKAKETVLIVALVAISAAPRLAGLGDFTSVDEPFWLRQGANFYYALGQRQFQNTIYEYHPAVTTMWLIAFGMLAYFPRYRALGQGYLKPGKFDLFLPAHGKDPLQLLIVSRALQVLVVIALLLLVYVLLRLLFGERAAFFATALISISPFLLGHSRLLNHEAMLGLFLLISLLSMVVYLRMRPSFAVLATSFISAALAQLTKSSGAPLFPLMILVLALDALMSRRAAAGTRAWRAVKTLGIWLAGTAASYVLFWPGMWVAPGAMLSEVYGNALSYTFQGARLSVLPGLQTSGLGLDTLAAGLRFYLSDMAWRTTPVTLVGALVGLGLAVGYQVRRIDLEYRVVVLYALLLAAAFLLVFSIQRGPKPPHYILTSYVCLDLIAGLGLSRAWGELTVRFPRLAPAALTWVGISLVLGIQLASSLQFYPYFISYYDPVLEALQPGIQNPTLVSTGYGVGLDRAAAYLSQKENASQLTVMSTNGYGCFSYYFSGRTIPMNVLTLSDPTLVSILGSSQYAVVDYYNQERSNLVADLEGVEPEKIIWINGIDFLHIYRASELLAKVRPTAP